jgi:hypothetical protein
MRLVQLRRRTFGLAVAAELGDDQTELAVRGLDGGGALASGTD